MILRLNDSSQAVHAAAQIGFTAHQIDLGDAFEVQQHLEHRLQKGIKDVAVDAVVNNDGLLVA